MDSGSNHRARGSAWRCGAVVALTLTSMLASCQQEMSRKDKGYSLPSFQGLPGPKAPAAQSGSSQNKGEVVGQ